MTEESKKPIFLFVSAGDCGACTRFKQDSWTGLKRKLDESGLVRIIHADLKSMGSSLPEGFPLQINKYRKFYPMFMMIKPVEWKPESQIDAVVFNMNIKQHDGSINITPVMSPRNFDSVFDWVKENANFSKSKPYLIDDLNNFNRGGIGVGFTVLPTMGCSANYVGRY